jgi:hypothetical protein
LSIGIYTQTFNTADESPGNATLKTGESYRRFKDAIEAELQNRVAHLAGVHTGGYKAVVVSNKTLIDKWEWTGGSKEE